MRDWIRTLHLLFFIVKYVNLWHWWHRLQRACILKSTETKFLYLPLFVQSVVCNLLKSVVKFIFVKSKRKVSMLAAEIDFFEQNYVRDLEPILISLRRHWLCSRMKHFWFSLVFTWFSQVYSSYCRHLLVSTLQFLSSLHRKYTSNMLEGARL